MDLYTLQQMCAGGFKVYVYIPMVVRWSVQGGMCT